MCGIVGYIGSRRAVPILSSGIKRLEYRGYDSSGIAVIDGHKKSSHEIILHKKSGKINEMTASMPPDLKESPAVVGIAHTRWATHGKPTTENAHPHRDCDGKIAVVHNGIIENYSILKERLIKRGHTFTSETDTEIIAHLIEEYMEENDNFESAVKQALKTVTGTYGIVALHSDFPDRIVVARNSSPLHVGIGIDEMIVASDLSAIIGHTQQVIHLEDGEISVLKKDDIETSDLNDVIIQKSVEKVYLELSEVEKGRYPHYMLKEIFEQPESLQRTYTGRLIIEHGTARLNGLNLDRRDYFNIKRVHVIACGTAMHSGLVAKYLLEEIARVPCEVEIASEFRYKNPIIDDTTFYFIVSQSGETADSLAALREIKRKGGRVAAISNVVGSSIARESGSGVFIHAGPEISVASTKAFTSQVTAFFLFALYIARMRDMSHSLGDKLISELERLPKKIKKILNSTEEIEKLAEKYYKLNNFLFVGRHINYPIAMEGALKLKEISYCHAEAYAAGELKHGAIALVDESMGIICIAPHDDVYEKNLSNIEEIKARKGRIIAITTTGDKHLEKLASDVIYVPRTDKMLTPLLTVIPLQLFAYYMALKKGCDIDKPRNLAKSVTVE
jgi:glucosamine--fructose-6-phosphate aminotransferase (isomerizing)